MLIHISYGDTYEDEHEHYLFYFLEATSLKVEGS